MTYLRIGFFLLVALLTANSAAQALCIKHDNWVYLESGGPWVGFLLSGHEVTDNCGSEVDVSSQGNGVKMDAKFGRKGSEDIADDFYNEMDYEHSMLGLQASSWTLSPDKLNFFIKGRIQIDRGENRYDFKVGQGHTGFNNNWWCGGTDFIGLSPREVICTRDGKYSIRGSDGSTDNSFRVTANPTHPNWMTSYIHNDKRLSEFAIPGTHDSGTYAMNKDDITNKWAVCQDYALLVQMYFGIRAFDMRLGVDSDGHLKVFHGDYETHLTFDTVIRQAFEFLDKNPGEAIIMFIKHEHAGDIRDKFTEVLDNRNPSGDRYWLNDQMPTMGEIRNKIVFVNRDNCINGGIHVSWQNDTTFRSTGNVAFYIQDKYGRTGHPVTYGTKKSSFLELQNTALNDPSGETWYVNFLSLSDDLPPSTTANELNPWAKGQLDPYANSGSAQLNETVMMNFPSRYNGFGVVADLITNNQIHSSNSLSINGAEMPEISLTSHYEETEEGNRSGNFDFSFNVKITDESLDPTQSITSGTEVYFKCGDYVILARDGRLAHDQERDFPGVSEVTSQGRARIFGYAGHSAELTWDSQSLTFTITGSYEGEDGGPNLLDLSKQAPGSVADEQEFVLRIGSYIWSGVIGYEGKVDENGWSANAAYLCPLSGPCSARYPRAR